MCLKTGHPSSARARARVCVCVCVLGVVAVGDVGSLPSRSTSIYTQLGQSGNESASVCSVSHDSRSMHVPGTYCSQSKRCYRTTQTSLFPGALPTQPRRTSASFFFFFFFLFLLMYVTKSGDYFFGKKRAFRIAESRKKRNDRKAALPAVLSDFG